ncbi:unnamed protein product [Boreogadus saida]
MMNILVLLGCLLSLALALPGDEVHERMARSSHFRRHHRYPSYHRYPPPQNRPDLCPLLLTYLKAIFPTATTATTAAPATTAGPAATAGPAMTPAMTTTPNPRLDNIG